MDSAVDYIARSELAKHDGICAERYGSLWSAINDLKADLRSRDAIQHTRFNTISNRMWGAVVGMTAASVIGLCTIAFYLITHSRL